MKKLIGLLALAATLSAHAGDNHSKYTEKYSFEEKSKKVEDDYKFKDKFEDEYEDKFEYEFEDGKWEYDHGPTSPVPESPMWLMLLAGGFVLTRFARK